mmetsp:Transcript_41490/g.115324  ORF Transcript_41490/g.115324 Transcript_41490/m.115324 type:complete len:204 (-) Transcript_41490:589-1200(-)
MVCLQEVCGELRGAVEERLGRLEGGAGTFRAHACLGRQVWLIDYGLEEDSSAAWQCWARQRRGRLAAQHLHLLFFRLQRSLSRHGGHTCRPAAGCVGDAAARGCWAAHGWPWAAAATGAAAAEGCRGGGRRANCEAALRADCGPEAARADRGGCQEEADGGRAQHRQLCPGWQEGLFHRGQRHKRGLGAHHGRSLWPHLLVPL